MQKAGEKLMQKGKSITVKKSFVVCGSRACRLVKQGTSAETMPE